MNYQNEQIRKLRLLVDAAERVTIPETPEVPDWDKSPESLECIGNETRSHEELLAIGLAWQVLAGELHDLLEKLASPDELPYYQEQVAALHARAREARLALISIEGQQGAAALDGMRFGE